MNDFFFYFWLSVEFVSFAELLLHLCFFYSNKRRSRFNHSFRIKISVSFRENTWLHFLCVRFGKVSIGVVLLSEKHFLNISSQIQQQIRYHLWLGFLFLKIIILFIATSNGNKYGRNNNYAIVFGNSFIESFLMNFQKKKCKRKTFFFSYLSKHRYNNKKHDWA